MFSNWKEWHICSLLFKGYYNGYANMVPTCFSKFTPYSLSVQYCQVENVFSRNILLVPLSVFEGKKIFAFIFTFCFSFGFAVFIHYILSGPFIHILFSCAMLFMMLLFFIDQ